MASPVRISWSIPTDELVQRRARALAQHQRVMDEAAAVAELTEQARRRAAAVPVYASPTAGVDSFRARVRWQRAG